MAEGDGNSLLLFLLSPRVSLRVLPASLCLRRAVLRGGVAISTGIQVAQARVQDHLVIVGKEVVA